MDFEIHLCSKGYFIVKFTSTEVRDAIISTGPWFWGSTGLFITPWFPNFDANTMEVTNMPVWVRLYNLPLHFWNENVLGCIGNTLGRYIKTDTQRLEERIFTFARICVEVDLSKGLPESIMLNNKQQRWTQHLDYENTAFRCRICRCTGHLQNSCPAAKRDNRKKKKPGKAAKGWQFPSEEPELQAEEVEPTPHENQQTDTSMGTQEQEMQEQLDATAKTQQAMGPGTLDSGGYKRTHTSDTSDSDKDNGAPTEGNQLVLIETEPTLGAWRKVEKKKGRKS